MQRNGVDLSWTYRYSCADSFELGGFPNAQRAAKTVLGLPTYPLVTDEHAQYICKVALEKYNFNHIYSNNKCNFCDGIGYFYLSDDRLIQCEKCDGKG